MGEHLPYKQRVSGSSPLTSTNETTHFCEWFSFFKNSECRQTKAELPPAVSLRFRKEVRLCLKPS